MTLRWIAAVCLSSALATTVPALAQSSASPGGAASAPSAPTGAAPGSAPTPGDPNSSYPLANGGTYQGPLTGPPAPPNGFYKGYNRT